MKLIMIHLTNFIVWVGVVFPQTLMDPAKWYNWWQNPSTAMELDLLASDIIAPYLQVFTLYLVRKFAKNMQRREIRDKYIKKDVTFDVFMQNQQLYKEIPSVAVLKNTPEMKKDLKERIKLV